jgi:hypothetical protein
MPTGWKKHNPLEYQSHRRKNEELPCSVPTCKRRRARDSRWCGSHFSTWRHMGRPDAKTVHIDAYDAWLPIAREFAQRQLEFGNTGYLTALDLVDDAVLAPGAAAVHRVREFDQPYTSRFSEAAAWLVERQVDAREIVVRLVAVVMFYAAEKPAGWDLVVLERQIARYVMKAGGRPAFRDRNRAAPFYRALGNVVGGRLKRYIAVIAHHVGSVHRENASLAQRLSVLPERDPRGGY